jgi:uncharacterized protein DUF1236
MIGPIRCAAAVLALLFASIAVADAQVSVPKAATNGKGHPQSQDQKLTLSPAQRATIITAIRNSTVSVTPLAGNLSVALGAQFPSSVQLYSFPEALVTEIPDIKPYRYTFSNDTLVLVDPTTMIVVATIRQ